MRSPLLLPEVDLPAAELSALRLDGEVVAVGGCYAPFDEPDGPALRAATVARVTHPRLVAERLTAAWVHGALAEAPWPATLCARVGARVAHRVSAPVREVLLDAGDLTVLGGLTLTTPLRTALDLARVDGPGRATVIRALLGLAGVGAGAAAAELERRGRLPGKRAGVLLLRRLVPGEGVPSGQPAETR